MTNKFDLELVKQGKPFGNKAWGKAVKWVYLEGAEFPLYVLFADGYAGSFTAAGARSYNIGAPDTDLFLLEEPKVWYYSLMRNDGQIFGPYSSLEKCKRNDPDALGHIQIPITGSDFEVCKVETLK